MDPEDYDEGQEQRALQCPHVLDGLQEYLKQLRRLNVGVSKCRHLSLVITHVEDAIMRLRESYEPFLEVI